MLDWIALVLPFALFLVVFVLLRKAAYRRRPLPRRRRKLLHGVLLLVTIAVWVIGIALSLSPAAMGAVAFVAVFVAVLPVLTGERRDASHGDSDIWAPHEHR